MNRHDMISQTLLWEELAKKAKARANAIRDQLAEDARAELAEQGTAPTWRLPDIGTVSLPVSQETVYVADPEALLRWVEERHPDQVETIRQVRASFQATLFAESQPFGIEGIAVTPEGEVVPGLGVRPGGQPLALRFQPSHAARQVAGAVAERLIGEFESTLGGPVVLADGTGES